MPELPDVQTFKRYLDATSLHQRISDVDVRNAYVVKGVSARGLARQLKGHRFESSRRHGKHWFVCVDEDGCLRLHFGMTGSLRSLKDEEKAPRNAPAVFIVEKNHRLACDDQPTDGRTGWS